MRLNFYKSIRKLVCIVLLVCSSASLWAQERTVTGTVSSSDGETLPFVTIAIKGTSQGVYTDTDGKFSVTVQDGSAVLVFSFVGYVKQEITVGNLSVINVVLQEDLSQLGEVVVVGYGSQTKREITGAIAKVDGKNISSLPTPSFEAALQGQAAGVQVIQGSGLAGSGSVIRIRGISSVSANADPLYVVDGIPITADNFLAEANWQNGAFNNNPLAALNPNDIESIEILKDAAASGIYGSRGSNGVILITTKRGKDGKPQFNFSTTLGTSDPVAKPNFVDGATWLQLRQEAWENDGGTGAVWIDRITTAESSPEERLAAFQQYSQNNTDWWDLLTQTGFRQRYDFSVNWGNDKLRAYVGTSYNDTESYIPGNKFKRFSLRGNFDYTASEKLDVSVSSSYSQGVNRRVRVAYTGGLGDAMSVALPIYPLRNPDDTFFRGPGIDIANPVFGDENFQGFTVDDRIIASLGFTYRPVEDMTIKLIGSYDYLDQKNDQWESGLLRNQFETDPVTNQPDPNRPIHRSERDIRFVNNLNITLTGDYNLYLDDKHRFKFLAGAEYQESVTDGKNNIVHFGAPGTLWQNNNSFGEGIEQDEGSLFELNDDKWNFVSMFGRVNYTFRDKYILQGTARVDGSSRFGRNNRFGFFPVISAGWLVSEEDFLANSNTISYLKVRASFGITGNANIPSNQWVGSYELNNGQVYNGQPILYPTRLENPDLKWETTEDINLGVEAGFFNERITTEISYYQRTTRDVLMNVTVPSSSGFSNLWDNVGRIRNQGVDLSITSRNIDTEDFQWTSVLNVGYNTNEVLDIGSYTSDAVGGGTNDTRIVIGEPVGTNFLVRYAGADPATGRPVYLDIDGNATFEYNEARDRVPAGDVLPDATGGFTNNFTYKDFNLSLLFVFTIGGNIYDSSGKRQHSFISDWNIREDVADRWRNPGDQAKFPRLTLTPGEYGGTDEWFNTDLWLYDASYVRLRNISFGYNLPSEFVSGLGLNNVNVSVSGTNLITWTKFPGLDPEIARDFDSVTDRNLSPNITFLTPPQEKSYNFTLNVTF